MLKISNSAYNKIYLLQEEKSSAGLNLRLSVKKGGCSGLEYMISFDSIKEGDVEIKQKDISILIDNDSYSILNGCSISYDDGLHGKGFEITNPKAKNTCGCGRSFN